MLLIVPADPLRPRRPDDHFAPEAHAAQDLGVSVALVDHDALARGDDVPQVVSQATVEGEAVYRGWMLRSERYAAFAAALAGRGVTLRTNGEQYRRAHELPGWYPDLADLTPRTTWTVGTRRADFDRARRDLGGGRAVLRDFAKSMKHHWHEAALIPDLGDGDAAWAVASRFLDLRGDDVVGGFVLRRFERFATAEVHTWWVDGGCVLVGAHPDSPHDTPPGDFDPRPLAASIAALRLPFVTVDLALRADGVWRIVELGDGQVSDRPVTIAPEALVGALFTDPAARPPVARPLSFRTARRATPRRSPPPRSPPGP
ncbi:ATP-grasp domain-containing protein [Micromonospora sp. NPDC047465]|uniref:ATP-grasp domain-containing protein n=1 Tax=Micromonospora sp. NPDC047465 TaxID=3154813 RepID=UPI00340670D9